MARHTAHPNLSPILAVCNFSFLSPFSPVYVFDVAKSAANVENENYDFTKISDITRRIRLNVSKLEIEEKKSTRTSHFLKKEKPQDVCSRIRLDVSNLKKIRPDDSSSRIEIYSLRCVALRWLDVRSVRRVVVRFVRAPSLRPRGGYAEFEFSNRDLVLEVRGTRYTVVRSSYSRVGYITYAYLRILRLIHPDGRVEEWR